ncbi:MAG: pantoate--beta-alanine ligase, partial [Bacteroidales bacterium]|nr:pantoate--beta-alanine ligase [Bacteroidales bacterium]
MKIINTVEELMETAVRERAAGKSIGMVPTMGALHEGHLSLIRRAHEENDVVFCSMFVNPVQFNNAEDLAKYPRTLEADVQLIGDLADYVFAPTVEEVFPVAPTEVYDFGTVANVMEGAARPGHFNGVGVIVRRLLEWTRPHKAYFGEKDYQQIAVIREMCA